jgi:hypothetical protein
MKRTGYGFALAGLIVLAIGLLVLLARTYLTESKRQAETAERSRRKPRRSTARIRTPSCA